MKIGDKVKYFHHGLFHGLTAVVSDIWCDKCGFLDEGCDHSFVVGIKNIDFSKCVNPNKAKEASVSLMVNGVIRSFCLNYKLRTLRIIDDDKLCKKNNFKFF